MSSKGKSSVASSSSSTRPHPFILVVEDVPLHYTITLRRITAVFNGAEVMHAKSYDEAMKTLGDQLAKKKMLPDLILSDCDLGRQLKHGPDLLKDLKNEKMYKNIPVVMYSAAMDYEEELQKKLMSAGAEAALHKPLKFAEIKKWEKFFDVEGLVVPDN